MAARGDRGVSMRAVIVASGPSARGFVPPTGLPVIAVNGAIDWIDRADYWFSLDASRENIKRVMPRNRRPGCEYHVAGDPWLVRLSPHTLSGMTHWKRLVAPQGHRGHRYGAPEWRLAQERAVLGICKTPGSIHTGNSAWGALGLAWHLGFRDVALVGVDANNESRVEGGRSGDLSHLPLLFASAIPDMRVVSCGGLPGIPWYPFKDWYEDR